MAGFFLFSEKKTCIQACENARGFEIDASHGLSLVRITTQDVNKSLVVLEPGPGACSDREHTRKGKANENECLGVREVRGQVPVTTRNGASTKSAFNNTQASGYVRPTERFGYRQPPQSRRSNVQYCASHWRHIEKDNVLPYNWAPGRRRLRKGSGTVFLKLRLQFLRMHPDECFLHCLRWWLLQSDQDASCRITFLSLK